MRIILDGMGGDLAPVETVKGAVQAAAEIDDEIIIEMINNTIANDDYDDVLTLIEAIIRYWDLHLKDSLGNSYYNRYTKQNIYIH